MVTYKYPLRNMKARDLQVGDIVRPSRPAEQPWSTQIVKQVTDDEIVLFRPYAVHSDCTYGAVQSVICHVGIEEFTVPRNDIEYFVYQRAEFE